jgi:hypothetical protein
LLQQQKFGRIFLGSPTGSKTKKAKTTLPFLFFLKKVITSMNLVPRGYQAPSAHSLFI